MTKPLAWASLVVSLFTATTSLAQSVLHFPRVVSRTDLFTGIAVSNPTSSDARVTFTAYQPDGTRLAGSGVQNPISITIPAGGQYARPFSEIFASNDFFNGWVRASS